MDSLFDTEFRHKHVEGCIQNADDDGGANDWAVTLRQIGNEDTKVQMR